MNLRIKWMALTVVCVALAAPVWADTTLYDSGAVNGGITGWNISGGFAVSNSFTLGSASVLNGVTFYSWTIPNSVGQSVDWSITTAPLGGAVLASGTGALTETFLFTDTAFGVYNINSESFSLGGVFLTAGTYWLQLENGITSDLNPIYWDQNNGSSDAYQSGTGHLAGDCNFGSPATCGSEAFYITGISRDGQVPEPSSLILLGSGFVGLAGTIRRKLIG